MTKSNKDELIKKINYHNIQYYIHDNPIISDYEYDVLLKELQNLENQYPELAFLKIHLHNELGLNL